MVLYKQINGRKIELTPEQEQAVRDEWAANELERQQQEQERQRREALIADAQDKIVAAAGISQEERQAYFRRTF